MNGNYVGKVERIKYLKLVLQKGGSFEKDMKHRT